MTKLCLMLFDRYRNKNKDKKKSSLATAFFKRFPTIRKKTKEEPVEPPPRPSISLPHIPLTHPTKRYSVDTPISSTVIHNDSTYPFSLTSKKTDLTLDEDERTKLNKVIGQLKLYDPGYLLDQLGDKPTPHCSYSLQHTHSQPIITRHRSESVPSLVHTAGQPLKPHDLVSLLKESKCVMLIDVRHTASYQKRHIRGSLNVNLPSLLIKRYQRGNVSNFNLENFITTPEEKEMYIQQQHQPTLWVVYDDHMNDSTSQAWTLIHVLLRTIPTIYYLEGGFQAFKDEDWIQHSIVPRRSISYTMGESKSDLYKRTHTLFSLDTQAARVNNAHALARRSNNQKSLNRVKEDDDTPLTDTEFIVSEILPGFLFVGPEIETEDQASQLKSRSIKRVLNMAEECEDQGLKLLEVKYRKMNVKDSVEMLNMEVIMMEAVQYIEEAKYDHEPIYVHCKAGKSRSITAILAYLITSEHWTLKKAYRHVIQARPSMSPNIGFISELIKLENKVHGGVSSFLSTDWQV
ncbi:hypothetical protein BDB01DRAFT_899924 [Pilobolus umbonatus]|nr:hypothetical protein BDB01DRAFT_899924 [Pilobolus umbonatus]